MQRYEIDGVGLVDFPDEMSEEEISSAIETQIVPNFDFDNPDPEQVALRPDLFQHINRGSWGSGLSAGLDRYGRIPENIKASVFEDKEALASLREQLAQEEKDHRYLANLSDVTNQWDRGDHFGAIGTFWTDVFPHTAAESLSDMLVMGGTAAAVLYGLPAAGIAAAGGTALLWGSSIAGIAAGTPSFIGQHVERQVQEGDIRDPAEIKAGLASSSAAAAASLEFLVFAVLSKIPGIKALAPATVGQMVKNGVKLLSTKEGAKLIGKGMAMGGVTEAVTEPLQSLLERAQAGLPISPSDEGALSEYIEAAVLGGTLGTVFGLGGGIVGTRGMRKAGRRYEEDKEEFLREEKARAMGQGQPLGLPLTEADKAVHEAIEILDTAEVAVDEARRRIEEDRETGGTQGDYIFSPLTAEHNTAVANLDRAKATLDAALAAREETTGTQPQTLQPSEGTREENATPNVESGINRSEAQFLDDANKRRVDEAMDPNKEGKTPAQQKTQNIFAAALESLREMRFTLSEIDAAGAPTIAQTISEREAGRGNVTIEQESFTIEELEKHGGVAGIDPQVMAEELQNLRRLRRPETERVTNVTEPDIIELAKSKNIITGTKSFDALVKYITGAERLSKAGPFRLALMKETLERIEAFDQPDPLLDVREENYTYEEFIRAVQIVLENEQGKNKTPKFNKTELKQAFPRLELTDIEDIRREMIRIGLVRESDGKVTHELIRPEVIKPSEPIPPPDPLVTEGREIDYVVREADGQFVVVAEERVPAEAGRVLEEHVPREEVISVHEDRDTAVLAAYKYRHGLTSMNPDGTYMHREDDAGLTSTDLRAGIPSAEEVQVVAYKAAQDRNTEAGFKSLMDEEGNPRPPLERLLAALENPATQVMLAKRGVGLNLVKEIKNTLTGGARPEGKYGEERTKDGVKKVISLSIEAAVENVHEKATGPLTLEELHQKVMENIARVLSHEQIHALRDLGIISEDHFKVLTRYVKKKRRLWRLSGQRDPRTGESRTDGVLPNMTYFDEARAVYEAAGVIAKIRKRMKELGKSKEEIDAYIDDFLTEEAVAEAFRDWAADKKAVTGRPASIFQRIVKFITTLGGLMHDSGIRQAQDIFDLIIEGKLEGGPATTAGPPVGVTGEKFAIAGPAVKYKGKVYSTKDLAAWHEEIEIPGEGTVLDLASAYDDALQAGQTLPEQMEFGFITDRGRFLERDAAFEEAQISEQLTEEGLDARRHMGLPELITPWISIYNERFALRGPAIKYKGIIYKSKRLDDPHADIVVPEGTDPQDVFFNGEQGFITDRGRFLNRKDAYVEAQISDQLNLSGRRQTQFEDSPRLITPYLNVGDFVEAEFTDVEFKGDRFALTTPLIMRYAVDVRRPGKKTITRYFMASGLTDAKAQSATSPSLNRGASELVNVRLDDPAFNVGGDKYSIRSWERKWEEEGTPEKYVKATAFVKREASIDPDIPGADNAIGVAYIGRDPYAVVLLHGHASPEGGGFGYHHIMDKIHRFNRHTQEENEKRMVQKLDQMLKGMKGRNVKISPYKDSKLDWTILWEDNEGEVYRMGLELWTSPKDKKTYASISTFFPKTSSEEYFRTRDNINVFAGSRQPILDAEAQGIEVERRRLGPRKVAARPTPARYTAWTHEETFEKKSIAPIPDTLGFHSQAVNAAQNFGETSGTSKMWRKYLRDNVKPAELETIVGLEKMLDSVKERISKEDMATFLEQNGIQLNEVVMTTEAQPWDLSEHMVHGGKPHFAGGNYVLPGGTNQREFYIVLPSSIKAREVREAEAVVSRLVSSLVTTRRRIEPAARKAKSRLEQAKKDHPPAFVANDQIKNWILPPGHRVGMGEIDNRMVVRIRVNDRVVNGKRILFIEEIQADRQQAARKAGGFSEDIPTDRKNIEAKAHQAMQKVDYLGFPTAYKLFKAIRLEESFELLTAEEIAAVGTHWADTLRIPTGPYKGGVARELLTAEEIAAVDEYNEMVVMLQQNRDKPPAIPWAKDNEWGRLALKRVIYRAVDEGYSSIAWTPAQAQLDRYPGIQQTINEVQASKEDDGTFNITGVTNWERGGEKVFDTRVKPEGIAKLVGSKELAKEIIAETGELQGIRRVYPDLDIKIGGKGMKAFYDHMVADIIKKDFKKFDAKVDSVTLDGNITVGKRPPVDPALLEADTEGLIAAERKSAPYGVWVDNDGETNLLRAFDTIEAANVFVEESAILYAASIGEEVHNFDIPDAMRRVVREEGFPKFSIVIRDAGTAKDGRYHGGPTGKPMTERQVGRLVDKLIGMALSDKALPEESRVFYGNAGRVIAKLSSDPQSMERLLRLVAYFSKAESLGGNTHAAIDAAVDYDINGDITVGFGRYPNEMRRYLPAILKAEEFDTRLPGVGNKIMSFYRNLRDEAHKSIDPLAEDRFPDESTLDRHMRRAMGYKTVVEGFKTDSQYAFGRMVMLRVAEKLTNKLGIEILPRQAQAMVWAAERNADKKPADAKADGFETYFDRQNTVVTPDAHSAVRSNDFPEIANYPFAVQRDFANAALELVTTDGRDILLGLIGRTPLFTTEVSAKVEDGVLLPNVTTQIVMPRSEDGAYDTSVAELYANVIGYIYGLPSMRWHRVDPTLPKGESSAGISILVEEGYIDPMDLYRFARDNMPSSDFLLIPRLGGKMEFRFLNTDVKSPTNRYGTDNKSYVDAIKEGIKRFPGYAVATVEEFRSTTGRVENDWEKSENGEDYRQRISEAGQPNLQGWADSRREAFLQLVEKTKAELDPDLVVQRAAERKIPTEEPGRLDRPVDGKRADRRRGRPGDKRRHVVTAEDLVGDESFEGRESADFFTRTVEGKKGVPTTGKSYTPVILLKDPHGVVADYLTRSGHFDLHIATSIPGFREAQAAVVEAVVLTYPKGADVLDIASSEGGLGRAISSMSGGLIRTVSLDPNPAMQAAFDRGEATPGAIFVREAFGASEQEGLYAWTEKDGTVISYYNPDRQFAVIHESMGFQFISNAREGQIIRAKEMLEDGGILLIEEKVYEHLKDIIKQAIWDSAENKKNNYKLQYYDQAAVDQKAEEILVGMHKHMVSQSTIEDILTDHFKFVAQYWDSGNFKGYVASDSAIKLKRFLANLQPLESDFAEVKTPRRVVGGKYSITPKPTGRVPVAGAVKELSQDGEAVTRIVFHGTREEGLPTKSYFGGIHFGTEQAAKERLDNTPSNRKGGVPGAEKILTVKITLNKPFGSEQNPVSEQDLHLIRAASEMKGPAGGLAKFGTFESLKEQGYDGIIYENIEEDKGSISYQVFESTPENTQVVQVVPTSEEAAPRPKTKLSIGPAPLSGRGVLPPPPPLTGTTVAPGLTDARATLGVLTNEQAYNILTDKDKTIWTRAGKWLRKQFYPGGLLPKLGFEALIVRDSNFKANEYEIDTLVHKLDKAIKQTFGKNWEALSDAHKAAINARLTGDDTVSLPEPIKEAVFAMRQFMDNASGQYVDILRKQMAAIVETAPNSAEAAQWKAKQDLIEIILGNFGKYINRSYQVFDDPNWYKKITPEVYQAAINHLVGNGLTQDEAQRVVQVLVKGKNTASDHIEAMIHESILGAKDLTALKKRKEIAPEIRALLGEYHDPRLNFARSSTKMTRLIWNQNFLDNILDVGEGVFLFHENNRPPEASKQIAPKHSQILAPLSGMWVTPETLQAFKDALGDSTAPGWLRKIFALNAIVKYGKTILSPTTQNRNFVSAYFFTVMNGHWDMQHMGLAYRSMNAYIFGKENGARDYHQEQIRNGVLFSNPQAGMLMDLLGDAKQSEIINKVFMGPGTVRAKVRAIGNILQKLYMAGDDFWKIIGFENELAYYMEAKGVTREEATPIIAKRIRDTYPTYSMVGSLMKKLRRFPLAGTFVSFPSEIIRTNINMVRYIQNDLADPDLHGNARRRIIGMAIGHAWAYATASVTLAWMGLSDDEEEALRLMGSPWAENSSFLFWGRDENGNVRMQDLSYTDPYNILHRPITALLRDQPVEEALVGALVDFLSPFLGMDIAAGALVEIVRNQKTSGGRVFNPDEDSVEQTLSIASHLIDRLQPGVTSQMGRVLKAVRGQKSNSGRVYDTADEVLGFLGFRISTFDPKLSLYFRTFEFSDSLGNARAILSSVAKDPNPVSEADLEDAFETADRARLKAFAKMQRFVNGARSGGMSDWDIRRVLKASGVSQRNVNALVRGAGAPKWRIGTTFLKGATKRAKLLIDKETADELRRRRRYVRQIAREHPQLNN